MHFCFPVFFFFQRSVPAVGHVHISWSSATSRLWHRCLSIPGYFCLAYCMDQCCLFVCCCICEEKRHLALATLTGTENAKSQIHFCPPSTPVSSTNPMLTLSLLSNQWNKTGSFRFGNKLELLNITVVFEDTWFSNTGDLLHLLEFFVCFYFILVCVFFSSRFLCTITCT